ncbi:prolyl oligopeptidase family serine peptidase [Pedobacter sp. LMG 31464]|uniref:Prolyl oligopeptidase family serine peptidase n=1 Tax=Pedobacter planticolens TaxID=2679964 RepID=A0A923IVN1_9SPHI|nr:prolyl oligopeptidase family serine peptidase [Pedobacter planticolens]MBB2146206.1 prolyl oligopeptidase family serine peptidase [Pedobacter planticolens]
MKKYLVFFLLLTGVAQAQQLAPLTVQKIMRDPKWMGVSPTNYRWSEDSKTVFFTWNPENKEKDQAYKVSVSTNKPEIAADNEAAKAAGNNYTYNKDKSLALYEKGGDIYFYNFKSKKESRLTNTVDRENGAYFLYNNDVVFQRGDNLFQLNLQTNEFKQLTNFVKGKRPAIPERAVATMQDSWLKTEQTELFDIIKKRNKTGGRVQGFGGRGRFGAADANQKTIKPIYLEDKFLSGLVVSPDGRFVSYRLTTPVITNHNTIVPNYVTSSGYTEDIAGRTKVGENLTVSENFLYDGEKDSVYTVKTAQITGIKDLPDYVKDYPKQLEERTQKNEDRKVNLGSPEWNENGTTAIITADAQDNKDLWVLKLDAATGNVTVLDRQRDEAWIGGPGVGRGIDWIDNNRFYFQSEATGYSHLYVFNVATGEKKQITSGKWEVQRTQLSKDKTTFYITANKEHPGITHFYKVSVNGGELVQITSMKGGNEITLSPDEKWLAINYSYMYKPWELYIQANKPGAKAVQITKSTTAEFDSYKWRQPDLVSFKNRYGDDVYARVYPAANPHPNKPAVVFVHGAGYLQNVHYWWSQYFREYMFNNLLADNGYTVIDIDYTASSGYGRNHRTGIYRDMGGKDLTDQVDGVKMLVEKYGVNPKHVGLYGGSYGGFITLMGMFKEPEVFAAGGALRSVTDWAHYNHGYTANILNEPLNDPIAYKRSSPIYYADKLKGNLLMLHGMVDENVHFQDIVRLTQRFIELGKDNWELAVYPVEDHGFVEPSSWTDEYKRIFKLFETTLKK